MNRVLIRSRSFVIVSSLTGLSVRVTLFIADYLSVQARVLCLWRWRFFKFQVAKRREQEGNREIIVIYVKQAAKQENNS
jgi:hypothetical protein